MTLGREKDPAASTEAMEPCALQRSLDNQTTKCAESELRTMQKYLVPDNLMSAIRIIGQKSTDSMEAQAFNYAWNANHIYTSSWGPSDDGTALDGPGTLGKRALAQGVSKGRDGRGSIFVFASGNGGDNGDNCNFDGYANSIYTISIGAINHLDQSPNYAERCSAHLAVTYSGGKGKGITTAAVGGKCTGTHSGTSAAAPIAAGIFALMLSARPELGWRDIQQLIVETAIVNDPEDSSWKRNGVGRPYSHKYGFGKLDANAMVTRAQSHQLLPHPSILFKKISDDSKQTIPLVGPKGVPFVSTIEVTREELQAKGLARLEHVEVLIRLKHPERRQVEIALVSPAGTRSVLATRRVKDESDKGFNPWTFMTVFNWGEQGAGIWKLEIHDQRTHGQILDEGDEEQEPGKLLGWELHLHGTCNTGETVEITDSNGGTTRTCGVTVNSSMLSAFGGEKALMIAGFSAGFISVAAVALLVNAWLVKRSQRRYRKPGLSPPTPSTLHDLEASGALDENEEGMGFVRLERKVKPKRTTEKIKDLGQKLFRGTSQPNLERNNSNEALINKAEVSGLRKANSLVLDEQDHNRRHSTRESVSSLRILTKDKDIRSKESPI